MASTTSGFAFFNDVRREFRGAAGADVFRCVNRPGRDEQRFTGLQRHRWRAVELIFQRAFEDIGDLRPRMRVPAERDPLGEIDADLDDLASSDSEIVPHDVAARDSRLLRVRHKRG